MSCARMLLILTSHKIRCRFAGANSLLSTNRQVPPLRLQSVAMSAGSEQKPKVAVDKSELKKRLTAEQFHVTQEQGTEAPWTGEFLAVKDNGMYGCIVCGADLFSSNTKYESGCGWPSFYDIEDSSRLLLRDDMRHGRQRVEVCCSNCGSHLGHVFDDGPEPTGKRYCINSVSLHFKKKPADEK